MAVDIRAEMIYAARQDHAELRLATITVAGRFQLGRSRPAQHTYAERLA